MRIGIVGSGETAARLESELTKTGIDAEILIFSERKAESVLPYSIRGWQITGTDGNTSGFLDTVFLCMDPSALARRMAHCDFEGPDSDCLSGPRRAYPSLEALIRGKHDQSMEGSWRTVVLIGEGPGFSAGILELRRRGFKGEILQITEEGVSSITPGSLSEEVRRDESPVTLEIRAADGKVLRQGADMALCCDPYIKSKVLLDSSIPVGPDGRPMHANGRVIHGLYVCDPDTVAITVESFLAIEKPLGRGPTAPVSADPVTLRPA
ncbi:MAG: hypothetical protein M3O22_02835 [Pseudomonadota bacterium]|nr:hypothetical protein [Pseudomonadota bacterium]